MTRTIVSGVILALVAGVALGGQLEPTDPPAPTMKTLNEIPPTWSQRLDSTNGSTNPLIAGCDSSRFKCVLYTGTPPTRLPRAVLDLETGLLWEREPSSDTADWATAILRCLDNGVGGRKGWRLPRIEELLSLADPIQTEPALPWGHPFRNVQFSDVDVYWSATTTHFSTTEAFSLSLFVAGWVRPFKTSSQLVWCVRGGTPTTFTSQPNQ